MQYSPYLFYGGDSDNKEERQTTGDWAGGGVNDKLQGRREAGGKAWGEGRAKTREEHKSKARLSTTVLQQKRSRNNNPENRA